MKLQSTTPLLRLPSPNLRRQLALAASLCAGRYLGASWPSTLDGLRTREQLWELNSDEAHPLWWFAPAISFDVMGRIDALDGGRPALMQETSIAFVPPPFVDVAPALADQLRSIGLSVDRRDSVLPPSFVAVLYGGYPWFEPYLRLCTEDALFGKPCVVLEVTGASDVPSRLLACKASLRRSLAPEISRPFADLPLPGLLRAYHTPEPHENVRHVRAAKALGP